MGGVASGDIGWREALSARVATEVRVAFKTGSMTWWVVDCLRQQGIESVVVDARSFKLVAAGRKKSDRYDARALADGLRGGLAERCAVSVPDTRTHRARSLMQTRQQWEFLEAEKQNLDAMVAEESGHWPEAEPLRELPGFGPVVTMDTLSGIGDISRFKRADQLPGYVGLIPSSRDSGGVRRRGGITRQGRGVMRHLAVQAVWAAMRSKDLTPQLSKWVRRLIVKGGRKVAAVALARRLLVLVHKILTNGEAYNPSYPVSAL